MGGKFTFTQYTLCLLPIMLNLIKIVNVFRNKL